jgi:hypothetical protein
MWFVCKRLKCRPFHVMCCCPCWALSLIQTSYPYLRLGLVGGVLWPGEMRWELEQQGSTVFLSQFSSVQAAGSHGGSLVSMGRKVMKRRLLSSKGSGTLEGNVKGRFRRFINDVAVKDMPLIGRKFTWSSSFSSSSPTLVKLDHVFCTVDWEDHFPNSLLQSAASVDSDHCPLILGLKDGCPGKRRFHFEVFWPKFDGFQQAVQQAWGAVQTKPCPLETLALKFKAAVRALQSWSDKKVEKFRSQLELAREILHQLEIAQDSRPLSLLEVWLRNSLKKHSLALTSLLWTVARLRSRIHWLKEGDANTWLFHSQARHRKRKYFIAKLQNGDEVVTSHEDKAELLLNFYEGLIGTREQREQTIDLEAVGIRQHDLHMLDSPISEEECGTQSSIYWLIKPPDRMDSREGSIKHVGIS